MSYRTGHHAEYPQHHPHDHGKTSARRPPVSHSTTAAPRGQGDYTLVHAGKQVQFGPVVFWIVVGTVTVLAIWSAATATYFAFRDDVLTRLIARQAEMQYAYEDRIADTRTRTTVPRAASCSIRNSSVRSSTRSCGARPRLNPAPARSVPSPILPDRSSRPRELARLSRRARRRQNPRRSATP